MDNKELTNKKEIPNPFAFFQIQQKFAEKVAEVTSIDVEKALLKYTTFYKRIGNDDWDHDPKKEKWRDFISGVREGQASANVAYQMYIARFLGQGELPKSCFSYSYDEDEKAVEIHFQNNSYSESPLSQSNVFVRTAELKTVFQDVKENHPDAKIVQGGSWLYNYDSYKRLFPPEYVANLRVSDGGLRGEW